MNQLERMEWAYEAEFRAMRYYALAPSGKAKRKWKNRDRKRKMFDYLAALWAKDIVNYDKRLEAWTTYATSKSKARKP